MKRVVFSTNIPSPYRVDFFNILGKYCDLTVLYERPTSSERDEKWTAKKAENYKEKYLELIPIGTDRARGSALKKYIIEHEFDMLFFTNYVSPATMEAITYCIVHKIEYFIEYDGGFNKKDKLFNRILKSFLLKNARGHFTTCESHIQYLLSLGIKRDKIIKYPFSSISKRDISAQLNENEKQDLRTSFDIKESLIILAVGQFIHRKGFDLLLQAAKKLPDTVGIFIVGGRPTDEYLKCVVKDNLKHVHFVEFKTKDELSSYYKMSDIFVLPTREDVWGLVVNEAMSFGLPIITTDKCNAGLELVKENGLIVKAGNLDELTSAICRLVYDQDIRRAFSYNSLEIIKKYTIETMAEEHVEAISYFFGGN